MILDSWLVARLARELHELLANARIQSLSSDRFGFSATCYRSGGSVTLRALLDPNGPILAATQSEDVRNENVAGGWAGGVAPLLRGSIIDAVRAVRSDRILNVDVSSRSAFGVPARHRLTFELEPRKANALVLRPAASGERFTVLAALKQFAGDGESRSVRVGADYEAPPAVARALDREGFKTAVGACGSDDARGLARALSRFDPACTPALARDVVERCLNDRSDAPLDTRLLEQWHALRPAVAAAAENPSHEVFAYRRGADVTACHLVPLAWAPGAPQRVRSLNEVCARHLGVALQARGAPSAPVVRKKLARMVQRCEAETASLRSSIAQAQQSEELRRAGDAIYANLAAIADRAAEFRTLDGAVVELNPALTAKENAAQYFRRYKKAHTGLAGMQQRLRVLARNKEFGEQLLWDLDRADALGEADRNAVYRDVAEALERRPSGDRAPARGTRRARKDTPVMLPGGALAFVGRSPKENERLTFMVAGPDDYWFHARGVPGAHVIVKLAEARTQLANAQIVAAARLAAAHSRAADAAKVEVDFTQRKHVRRQAKSRPGLVWYTEFRTVLVRPEDQGDRNASIASPNE